MQRIDRSTVETHLVVQMKTGGPAGVADVTDDVAALDAFAGADRDPRQVTVARSQTEAVRDVDVVPQAASGLGLQHDAVGGGSAR